MDIHATESLQPGGGVKGRRPFWRAMSCEV